jgi:hypothetical protein
VADLNNPVAWLLHLCLAARPENLPRLVRPTNWSRGTGIISLRRINASTIRNQRWRVTRSCLDATPCSWRARSSVPVAAEPRRRTGGYLTLPIRPSETERILSPFSLPVDPEVLDYRPPFLNIGLHKPAERFWRLLVLSEKLQPKIDQARAYCRDRPVRPRPRR